MTNIIQYEQGMSDGSRDKRDGREHANTMSSPDEYARGYRRGWNIVRMKHELNESEKSE